MNDITSKGGDIRYMLLDIAKLNIVSVLDCVSLGGHNQERERSQLGEGRTNAVAV